MTQKPFRTILADWIGEVTAEAREWYNGAPKMGKFEIEELYRQGKKFLETPEPEPPKFGGLTNAQRERLEMLAEEAAEIVKCTTKILRHGYESYNPDVAEHSRISNKNHLEKELLELWSVYERMAFHGDVNRLRFDQAGDVWMRKRRYTHHQPGHKPVNHPPDGPEHVNPYQLLGKDHG